MSLFIGSVHFEMKEAMLGTMQQMPREDARRPETRRE